MHLQKSLRGLKVQAPAKLNLFFEVLGKRDDGYHEIETLVYPINLYDTLYFREDAGGRIKFGWKRGSGSPGPGCSGFQALPDGADNLVVQAVELLRRRSGVSRGATLQLVKRIPSSAGLGGGSSDAAAALVLANAGWALGWSAAQLGRLGAELGSDVPLFLVQGPAICRGRGEQVAAVTGLPAVHFVVVRPPDGLSTPAVYGACQPAAEPRSAAPLLEALAGGDLAKTGGLLFNRLESAAEKLSPWIKRLREAMAQMDCPGYRMTGSGSCYFGLCRHARQAQRVARRLRAEGVGTAYAVRGCR